MKAKVELVNILFKIEEFKGNLLVSIFPVFKITRRMVFSRTEEKIGFDEILDIFDINLLDLSKVVEQVFSSNVNVSITDNKTVLIIGNIPKDLSLSKFKEGIIQPITEFIKQFIELSNKKISIEEIPNYIDREKILLNFPKEVRKVITNKAKLDKNDISSEDEWLILYYLLFLNDNSSDSSKSDINSSREFTDRDKDNSNDLSSDSSSNDYSSSSSLSDYSSSSSDSSFWKMLILTKRKISLIEVSLSNSYFKKLFKTHYPKSKGIVGRRILFAILVDNLPAGIIGFASPPLSYKKAEDYFDLDKSIPAPERAKLYLNNNVFRLEIREKNLGTQVLKQARRKVKEIYEEKYKNELIGLITFVEPPRTGAVYKADNWDFIGYTEGWKVDRRTGERKFFSEHFKDTQKLIFGYKYKR